MTMKETRTRANRAFSLGKPEQIPVEASRGKEGSVGAVCLIHPSFCHERDC